MLSLQVVGGIVAARLSRRREERAGLRIVAAVREKLEHQEWMGRPAFAQVTCPSKVIRIVGVVATKGGSSQSKALARSTSQN
jgi:hypothetical protein